MTPLQALEQINSALKQINANYETHTALQQMVQIIARELQAKTQENSGVIEGN